MYFLSCSMCNVLFVASFCMLNVLCDTVDTMWNVVTHEKLLLIAKSQTWQKLTCTILIENLKLALKKLQNDFAVYF